MVVAGWIPAPRHAAHWQNSFILTLCGAQGPEWLWPVGFLLRGMLRIGKILGPDKLGMCVHHFCSHKRFY